MATLLDVGLLNVFGIIFPFLFMWAVVYAGLTYTKLFTDNKSIHALIATMLAFMTLFSRVAVKTINTMAPWFVLLFVALIFIFLTYMLFGITHKDIGDVLKSEEHGKSLFYWVLALVLIIAIGSLTSVISEERGFKKLGQATPDGQVTSVQPESAETETGGFFTVLFHPKVLGMALLLLVAFFTISQLTDAPKK